LGCINFTREGFHSLTETTTGEDLEDIFDVREFSEREREVKRGRGYTILSAVSLSRFVSIFLMDDAVKK
jgi:hypothetical protein